jgi:hypothetical protein
VNSFGSIKNTTLSYRRVKLLEIVRSSRQAKTSAVVVGRQWPMEVLGVVRLLAEAGVVIGQETRQQLVSGGDGADTLKTKLLDQAILEDLVGALDAALRLRRVGAQNVDVERVRCWG